MAHTSYWPRSVMADFVEPVRELNGLKSIVANSGVLHNIAVDDDGNPIAGPFWVPIRTQSAWDAAIQWLEDRAKPEPPIVIDWDWPKWQERSDEYIADAVYFKDHG